MVPEGSLLSVDGLVTSLPKLSNTVGQFFAPCHFMHTCTFSCPAKSARKSYLGGWRSHTRFQTCSFCPARVSVCIPAARFLSKRSCHCDKTPATSHGQ